MHARRRPPSKSTRARAARRRSPAARPKPAGPPLPPISLRDAHRRRHLRNTLPPRARALRMRIFHGADHPSPCAQTCAMIPPAPPHRRRRRVLVGLDRGEALRRRRGGRLHRDRRRGGSAAEIDTPGRAWRRGGAAARGQAQAQAAAQAKWQECEAAAAAPAGHRRGRRRGPVHAQAELDAATKGLFTQDDLDGRAAATRACSRRTARRGGGGGGGGGVRGRRRDVGRRRVRSRVRRRWFTGCDFDFCVGGCVCPGAW